MVRILTQCISHVPVGLDVVRREGDLSHVAEPGAVDVRQRVAHVAADGSELFLACGKY